MAKTLVLMGAGASFGSEPYSKVRTPPLGKNLFEELEKAGGIAASLPECIKEIFKADFELGMIEYQKYSDKEVGRYIRSGGEHGRREPTMIKFQLQLAYYLARFLPSPFSIYLFLIRALGIKEVVYSSLNYDLLFEQCALNMGLGIRYDWNRKGATEVCLVKPHGSSNFWPDIGESQLSGILVANCPGDLLAPIYPIHRAETLRRCKEEDSLAPSMSVYAPGKEVRVSPYYVAQQQQRWKEALAQASHVFIVGTRVHKVDQHIWEPLASSSAQIHYFGLESDRNEFEEWKASARVRDARFVCSTFDQSVLQMRSIMRSRVL
jgi:hypothetical protein